MIPKFRAWDKVFKEMVQVNALVLDEQVVKVTYKNGNVAKEDMKEYELMQSTGLKDKNGKEIFEGDILTDGHTLGVLQNHQALGFYMVDEKGKESFLSDTVDTEGFEEAKEFMENSIEILGNIYENPELLEVE